MRPAVPSFLAAAVLAACNADLAQAPKRGGASAAPRADRASKAPPVASPAAPPSAGRGPGSGATPAGGRLAASFAPVASTTVTGIVRLDASYIVAAGAGNIVAAGGGNIVAAGAGNLISDDGGTLIGADGGSLIGADGGSLIGADGGSLIGADGGSLIGADGGSLIGADGGSYRLATSGGIMPAFRVAAADAPPPGVQLPGQGLRVRIFELESGQPVLASRDPAARAGAWVRTDAEGRFSAPVLAGARGNVLVVADVRGVADPRLQLTGITRPAEGGAEAAIDEELGLVTYYLRLIVFHRLRAYMRAAGTHDGTINHGTSPVTKAEEDLANQAFGRILTAAKAKGVQDYPDPKLDALIGRLQDVVLAHMPVREVAINKAWTPEWTGPAEALAFDTLLGAMKDVHDRAAAKRAADPDYFTPAADAARARDRPPLEGVEAGAPVGWTRVLKPADVPRFMIRRYVASAEDGAFSRIRAAYHDLGFDVDERHRLKVAVDGYLLWVFSRMAFDLPPDDEPAAPGMLTQLVRVIEASDQPGADRPIPPADATPPNP